MKLSYEGEFTPPVTTMTHSVVPIGGPGRCRVSHEGLVFEGMHAGVTLKALALAIGSGALLWLVAWSIFGYFSGNLWDTEIGGYCVLVMIGTASRMKRTWSAKRPSWHEVSFDGVGEIDRSSSGRLRFHVPGIKRRGVIFFKPADGPEPLLEAIERSRAEIAGEQRSAAATIA